MKTLLALLLAASTALAAKPAEKTKMIYGQPLTKADFDDIKAHINPKWKPGPDGVEERYARFQKEAKGKPPELTGQGRFDEQAALAHAKQIKSDLEHFYIDKDGIYVLTNTLPLVFPPTLKLAMTKLHMMGSDKKPMDKNTREEPDYEQFSTSSMKGKSMDRYTFPAVAVDDQSWVKSGEATFEVSLPTAYQTFELTKEKPKAGEFELVQIDNDRIKVKFNNKDGSDFQVEVLNADGKDLALYELEPNDPMMVVSEMARTKTWDQIPDNVPKPSSGTLDFFAHGPAKTVLLFKSVNPKTSTVKSKWKVY